MLWATTCLVVGFLGAQVARGQGTVIFNNRITGTGGLTTHVWSSSSTNPGMAWVGLGSNDSPSGTTPFGSASATSMIGYGGSGGHYGYKTTFAQLLAAPGADQPESNLVPAGQTTTFRSGASVGGVAGIVATLGNVPKDAPVATVQMVAWDNSSGLYPTWTEAYTAWWNGFISAGKSVPFNVYNIGGDTNPAAALVGVQSFNLLYPGIPRPQRVDEL